MDILSSGCLQNDGSLNKIPYVILRSVISIFDCRRRKQKQSTPNLDNNTIDDPDNVYTYIDATNLQDDIRALADKKQLSKSTLYFDAPPMYQNVLDDSSSKIKNAKTDNNENTDMSSGDKAKVDNYNVDPGYADMDYAATAFGASNQAMKDAETKASTDVVENAAKEEAIPQYATVNKPKSDDRKIVENEL